MRTHLDCVPCFVSQSLRAARRAGADEAQAEAILRRALEHVGSCPWSQPPPRIAEGLFRVVREETGRTDPYRADKCVQNRIALDLLPALRRRIEASADPFVAAVGAAVAGNVLDLGALAEVGRAVAERALSEAWASPPAVDHTEMLRLALQRSRGEVLYVADNAGEIVFDRLLVEQILDLGVPAERVTVMVRGGPAINDALREDATVAGLDGLVEVVDTGTWTPGLVVDIASPEARARFARAEVVVSKGQGNLESLPLSDPRIFFLLRVKCSCVANRLRLPLGSHVVLQGGVLD